MNVLVYSSLFPNCIQPNKAVFVKHRMAAVNRYYGAGLHVVAPIPYFPPLKQFSAWYQYSQIPKVETLDNIPTYHPRYLVTPKIGMSFYGWWMFLSSLKTVKSISKQFPIDLIDAHYVFPDGFAAVLLGKAIGKPVIVSARGTDINMYPQLPIIRPLIKYVLNNADHVVSVCGSLKEIMRDLGTPEDKISVIPNGIDPNNFYRLDRAEARRKLDICPNQKMLVTVGQLIERKGIHILLDALNQIKKNGNLDFSTYIIGNGDMYSSLSDQIDRYGLDSRVKLAGEVKNKELIYWYNAANTFFLGSSREGWPNVIGEALACGVPVVSTPVNGVPEIITSKKYGIMVERNAESFARGILKAFNTLWDYDEIHTYGQSRTWETVATEVHEVFQKILKSE